jgi:hypothetical protein
VEEHRLPHPFGVAGMFLVIAGLAFGALTLAIPSHGTTVSTWPILRQTGEFGKALVPTGQTQRVTVSVTVLPADGGLAWIPSNPSATTRTRAGSTGRSVGSQPGPSGSCSG